MNRKRFHPAAEHHRTPRPTRPSVRVTTLPPDLLAQSCRRVAIVGVTFAVVWTIAIVLNSSYHHLMMASPMRLLSQAWPWPSALIHAVGVVSSLALVVWIGRFSPASYTILNVGLVYEVFTAFLIGLINGWSGEPMPLRGLSWIAPVVLVYPMIAPSVPGRTFAAAFAAASMDPIGFGIAALRGVEIQGGIASVVWAAVPNYICAALTIIPTRILTNLGRQVSSARELGSYRLGELLASGGMGDVYRAKHRLLARPAAIKLIRPDVLGARSPDQAQVIVKRFQREAAAAAALRSPHTIELYDFGVGEDGTLYLVEELLDGVDLETLVQRFGPVPPERVVHLLRQACDSLAEAHDRDLVHRDIKPSNLFASRLGRQVDVLKVLDFGLVKADRGDARDLTKLTAPEALTGTPAFMAPELVLGSKAADRRADIYALGCVGYWLLTGRLVFEAANPVAMVFKHVEEDPVPPSKRSEYEVPPELEALILACLAKQPEDRPADADEVARRLAAVPLEREWTEERAQSWWATHLPPGQGVAETRGEEVFAVATVPA